MRSLESWFTASVFLCLRTCSTPSCLRFAIVALAPSNCAPKSPPNFVFEILAAAVSGIDLILDAMELVDPFASPISLLSDSREVL